MNIEDILNQVGPLKKFKSTYRAVGVEEIERAAALIEGAQERVRGRPLVIGQRRWIRDAPMNGAQHALG